MGVGSGLVFDTKLPEADGFSKFTDGKDLAHALCVLDEICVAQGLMPFSTFAPDMDELSETWSEGDAVVDVYFSCADALHIIPNLIGAGSRETLGEEAWQNRLRGRDCEFERTRTSPCDRQEKKAKFYLLYY